MKLGNLLYRRNVETMERLQYPEKTTSILRSGTEQITEGKCNQPARAAYPYNVNYKKNMVTP
jgi:hypothetical protein